MRHNALKKDEGKVFNFKLTNIGNVENNYLKVFYTITIDFYNYNFKNGEYEMIDECY